MLKQRLEVALQTQHVLAVIIAMTPSRARQCDVDDFLDRARARRHHRNPVRQKDRFADIVRHEQRRVAGRFVNAQQLVLHDPAGLRIERAERLVHQQDFRIVREAGGDRYALLHAA